MASAEVNTRPQPLFWKHVATGIRSLPRAAILSMVGPLLLCVLGYFGWRYYGAPKLDMAYYALKKENIHVSAQPRWLKNTNVLDEVFGGSSLANLSLLDGQTSVILARAFDAHPCVQKTASVHRMAGQIMVNLEYRMPVAMVRCPSHESNKADDFFPVDAASVVLVRKNFTNEDVPQYIWIYHGIDEKVGELFEGKPFGDSGVEKAAKLCALLLPYREAAKITRVYVYKSRWLELETEKGPRIQWGSAPGEELLGEQSAQAKLKRLIAIASDSKQWSQENINLAGSSPILK